MKEKPKAIGSDWVLESVDVNVVATTKGNLKKNDFEILTAEKQIVARCCTISENSLEVDILGSNFDHFLILSYVIVLKLAKVGMAISKFRF